MTGDLYPVTDDELARALAPGRGYKGHKRILQGDAFMVRLMADHLVNELTLAGLVAMKRPYPCFVEARVQMRGTRASLMAARHQSAARQLPDTF